MQPTATRRSLRVSPRCQSRAQSPGVSQTLNRCGRRGSPATHPLALCTCCEIRQHKRLINRYVRSIVWHTSIKSHRRTQSCRARFSPMLQPGMQSFSLPSPCTPPLDFCCQLNHAQQNSTPAAQPISVTCTSSRAAGRRNPWNISR